MSDELNLRCPCCATDGVQPFHETRDVPVNSVLMLATRQEAIDFPTGDIVLGFCGSCGFIYNTAFDPARLEYSERYDPTQAFSATFNTWHRQLAENLVERFDLKGKRVIEIGCGKGEFLHLLAEVGGVKGVGFDPAYDPGRDDHSGRDDIEFVADRYSEKYTDVEGDFVCCKMTLEHIADSGDFIGTVRRAVGDDAATQIFFQVPDILRILEETAFWDIYYEHCSYFSMGSLGRLFRHCQFDVLDLAREYDDQYLMIDARPTTTTPTPALPQEADLEQLSALVARFADDFAAMKADWQKRLAEYARQGSRAVIWGSGSKGVAFLTTLGIEDSIEYVVDINPHRQGFYMAKTGQKIVGPEFLKDYQPGVVIVMNPIYRSEIEADLKALGLSPDVITA